MPQQILMYEVRDEEYESANGFTLKRESGLAPTGTDLANRWVLRDVVNAFIDVDQSRHDLMVRHGFSSSPPPVR